MFPNGSFDITPFRPLDVRAFWEKVLLPEIGILLIQQDLSHLDRASAIGLLCASQEFSSQLHPGTDSPHVDNLIQRVSRVNHETEKDATIKREDVGVELTNYVFKEIVENGEVAILLDN
jgi:hypothetical protein